MKKIESLISPLIENQFPSFYKEEGPQFIAFVKAYYEWLESANNIIYHTRRLPDYRDIDTTVDEFILQFKEKYLKNIQFDTATNKQLLIKNSLNLYRSKGTERSIDLFFKLVYGTSAEVRYPADNILRVSDGIWERPEYLEITYSRYNVDYVGKQIIGSLSGAKAFVEKFIRRRTSTGYVDILYISGRFGNFSNGELIGLNVNNTPVYDIAKRAKLIGSINHVIIQDRGRDFKVGDIVSFTGTTKGIGGLARVESVSEAAGIVDFIFIDGGYGYTVDTQSIISEKVLSLEDVRTSSSENKYFRLFEQAIEPIISISFTGASANLSIGDSVFRYAANGQVVGSGKVIDIDQINANGVVTISHTNGVFTNTTYYTPGNSISFYANTVIDKSISGKIMGITQNYTVTVQDQLGSFDVGQEVLHKNALGVVGSGTIQSVTSVGTTSTLILNSAAGVFPVGERLQVSSNSLISANVAKVDLNAGVYEIKKMVNTLTYFSANNNEITNSDRIYRYDISGKKIAEGILLTISHDSDTASGNLTFIPVKGYFTEADKFYTNSNTSQAIITTYTTTVGGGDYAPTKYSRIITPSTNTFAILSSTSFGSGAQFNIGTIGDKEDIFIGTDLITANGVNTLDYDRVNIAVTSNPGFAVGDKLYQETSKIAFNPSSSVNSVSGFITIPSANSRFIVGDIIKYQVSAGNTALNHLINNDYYYVAASNTTGLILSYPYRKLDQINSTNFATFANNKVNESGHYFYKLAHGMVFETGFGVIRTKDNYNFFGNTGGTANVTSFANSNIIKYGATTNTAINAITVYSTVLQAKQTYASIPITSSTYGFPKNPQGDVKNSIFSCLSFNKFTIGSIGSLSGIDPGSGYNVDPYVLTYQPYISSFNRRDFVMKISDATVVFARGEKVNQTFADIIYYDLKVDAGAYSNTFDEKLVSVNTADEINSNDDFILYTSNTVTFNTSDDIDFNSNFIYIPNADTSYPANSYVRYYTNTGNNIVVGLSNNTFYYIATSNSSGISLSLSQGGPAISIVPSSTIVPFNSNTSVNDSSNFISIPGVNSLFANGDQVRYITSPGESPVTGLSNNSLYYVRYANSSGLALSVTPTGANVDISGLNPGGAGNFLRYYNSEYSGHNLVRYANEFANNQKILYKVPTLNTPIPGLVNDTAYYIVGANTIGFKLSDTVGGSVKAINAAATGELHTFSTVPGFLPGDRLYVNSSPVVNVTVKSIYTVGANSYVRVSGNTGVLTTNTLHSYSNPYVSANVSNIALYQITSTAKGVVKSANTSEVRLKRLTFENTFKEGTLLIGEASGASANVISVSEDLDVLYPIGLNANIEANVITANGQVTSLQVVDSGIAYSNSSIVQYTSADGTRSGSIKVIVDGHGIGQGYYKSSKGFLSEDMYIHDGDYYQEYSYEILSKMSIDRYSDVFKKVMHTAGTKFFGSALIVEEDYAPVELSEIAIGQEVQFNSQADVSSVYSTIEIDITPNPFSNGDIVKYTTATSNTVVQGLANNTNYYIVQTSGITIKLSNTANGTPINITSNTTASGVATSGHYLTKIIEE